MNWVNIWKVLRWSAYGLLSLVLLSLLPTEVFVLQEPDPFSGENWHNPYQDLDTNAWQKGNFHAHTSAWGGLSNGHGSPKEVYDTYIDSLGYDWAGISNYQAVDLRLDEMPKSIQAYEHGIGWQKHHQLLLGEANPNWFDFPLWQQRWQKQTVISNLQHENNLLVLAHPKLRGAYSLEDMQYLSGYDCMEVLNHIGRSREHWDAALSAGTPVYLLSSDDCHNHQDLNKIAQNITLFKTDHNDQSGIINALKSGHSFGVDVQITSLDHSGRREQIKAVPYPKSVKVQGDTLTVRFSRVFAELSFIGQGGETMATALDQSEASYILKSEDTYIRMAANFKDSPFHLYSNPIFRYQSQVPVNAIPPVSPRKTRLYRLSILYILFGLWALVWRIELAGKRKSTVRPKIKWAIP